MALTGAAVGLVCRACRHTDISEWQFVINGTLRVRALPQHLVALSARHCPTSGRRSARAGPAPTVFCPAGTRHYCALGLCPFFVFLVSSPLMSRLFGPAWQAGVFLEPGVATESTLNEGDAGYAPRGSGHYFINTNETHDAYVILVLLSHSDAHRVAVPSPALLAAQHTGLAL